MTSTPPDPHSSPRPTPAEATWAQHRQRVLDIGYRMMGTLTDAEDIAQEVFIKLDAANLDEISDPLGWLVTVTSRLCLDRLRLHEHSRRAYVGPWLPEPVVDVHGDAIGDHITLDESVRMALMVVLERLSPPERAAFILHDVFSLPFSEIGTIVGRSEQACRQLATRARRRIRDEPTVGHLPTDPELHREVAQRFAAACRDGDVEALTQVLAADAVGDFDSGGVIPNAPLGELTGAHAIAKQLIAAVSGFGADFVVRDINGDPGVLITMNSTILAAVALGVHDGHVDLVHGIGNPAKLRHLQPDQ